MLMVIQNNIENETDILQYAADSGIINVADIRDAVEQMNKKQMLSLHSQKIWQGKDGCWHTHLIMEDGKCVVRHRKTKEELEDYLVQYYESLEAVIRIRDVFQKWINEKLEYGEIKKQSYDRYCVDFDRYFKPEYSICKKKFKHITEADLEQFIRKTIQDLELTRKAYSRKYI